MRSPLLIAAGRGVLALFLLLFVPFFTVLAQPGLGAEQSTSLAGSPSLRSIPAADQLWRKTMWRAIDLREKPNRPLFAQGHQITQVLIAAVKRGELPAYQTDSLQTRLSAEVFRQRLIVPGQASSVSEFERDAGFPAAAEPDGWVEAPAPGAALKPATAAGPAEYLPRQLYQLEMKEDAVFDKRRSRMYHKIRALTIIIPAAETPKGYDIPVASFDYADLVRLFRAHPDEAIWFNPQNSAQHKNLADAFELWLFSSYITKVENPEDKTLAEIYGGGKAGLYASQQAAADLIEFEDNLWSH